MLPAAVCSLCPSGHPSVPITSSGSSSWCHWQSPSSSRIQPGTLLLPGTSPPTMGISEGTGWGQHVLGVPSAMGGPWCRATETPRPRVGWGGDEGQGNPSKDSPLPSGISGGFSLGLMSQEGKTETFHKGLFFGFFFLNGALAPGCAALYRAGILSCSSRV